MAPSHRAKWTRERLTALLAEREAGASLETLAAAHAISRGWAVQLVQMARCFRDWERAHPEGPPAR
jgi:GrpB-like predicted nucleotidyltransferase (UPF0157 family)